MSIRQVAPADGSGAVTINWDNSQIKVPVGVILDVQPGSALESAYELDNLTTMAATVLADDQPGDGGQATAARRRTEADRWRFPGSWSLTPGPPALGN